MVFVLSAAAACAQAPSPEKIRAHIGYIASDKLQGRGTGTAGERLAADYIIAQYKKLKLKPYGDNKTYLQLFEFKGGAHGGGTSGKSNNVVGFLDNKAPTTIIIGAHYDHLGMGDQSGSLDPNAAGQIHNGADDNASGVAGVLELARYFQTNKIKEKNNFLFICFSGEELGLIGSSHFTNKPTIDLSTVNYMINLDMVGRFDPKRGILVSGSGTSPVWEPMLQKLGNTMIIKTDSSGTGPSDHTSFNLKNIPVLHFFTNTHEDYHKPSDDFDKINDEGEALVLNLIIKIIEKTDPTPKLTFLPTKSKMTGGSRDFKVTLGIMPAYEAEEVGVKANSVSEGRPAKKAGIIAGDIIIQIGDYKTDEIESYMKALGKFEKGQTVPVKVKRGDQELTFMVTF